MSNPRSVAFRFVPQSFRGTSRQIMGFQSANRSLLEAVARYGSTERLVAYALDDAAFREFEAIVKPFGRATGAVPMHRTEALRDVGTLIVGGIDLAEPAWGRRFDDPRAFSVVGVLHSFMSGGAEAIGRWFHEPLEAWDAVVCASKATRDTVEALIDRHGAWLSRLHGQVTPPQIQLPVLPLGVHADRFAPTPERLAAGRALRERLGIAPDAVVALHVGRLSWVDKANPFPMFDALERVVRADPGVPVELLVAGWAYDDASLAAMKASAARWCPSVRVHWIDGVDPGVMDAVRAASDVFVSFADNVQETFGLTPVEAMAAGLPCVVSDWDGYRDTVRDGVDGFLVPTRTPPSGAARSIGAAFPSLLQGSALQRALAQCTEVDVGAAALALAALIRHPALRRQQGEAARTRVAEVYDWRALVPRYEALWDELAAIRASAPERAPRRAGEPAHPVLDDPFDVFSAYPSARMRGSDEVVAAPWAVARVQGALRDEVLSSGVEVVVASRAVLAVLLTALSSQRTVDDLLAACPDVDPSEAWRGLSWLAKIGAVIVAEPEDDTPNDLPLS